MPIIEARFRQYAKAVGKSWRVDQTYVKLQGKWVYLYRAVDKTGKPIDFFLSPNRDRRATKNFFREAIKHRGVPMTITLDGYEASHQAVKALNDEGILPKAVLLRSNRYLNNLVEQNHRRIKQRIRHMLGFKRLENARNVIAGIELAHQLRKGQFHLLQLEKCALGIKDSWLAVLAA